jgi:capsular exopolysaccharide synthesis family protein
MRLVPTSGLPQPVYAPPPPEVTRLYAPPPETEGFAETLQKLWRHRTTIFLVTLVFAIASVAVAKLIPTYYAAEARVLVGVPPLKVLNIESILSDMNPDADRIQNESYVVQSREVASAVVSRMALRNDPEFNPFIEPANQSWWTANVAKPFADFVAFIKGDEKAEPSSDDIQRTVVDVLLSQTSVTQLGRSHVLAIKVRSENPERSAALGNAFAEAYLGQQRDEKIQASEEADRFLTSRIEELRQQVAKSDQAVEDYRRRYGLFKGASAGITSQQLTELNTQLMAAQTAKAEAESRLVEAQAMGGKVADNSTVPEVLRSPLVQSLKQQSALADQKLAEVRQRVGARHPDYRAAQAEAGSVRGKIGAEVSRTVEGLRREVQSATARYEQTKRSFEQLKVSMGGVNDRQITLDALERDANVNRHLLEQMLGRAKEMIGQQQLQRANAKLISRAAIPSAPAFPPKPLIVLLGVIAGALAACIWALMRESLDRTFRRGRQMEAATGLPVLAVIPQVKDRMGPMQHVLRKPVSPYTEALRKLHTGLELSEAAYSPKLIMFCSAVPDEGKSVLVGSLGRMLAAHGRRVLLIDCDWRRPALHTLFRLSNEGGLGAVLDERADQSSRLIHTDPLSGVDILTAGDVTPAGVRMLTSERFRTILHDLADSYDMVLLDTPPVLIGAEVLSIARMVDKVAFVTRWGSTPRQTAMEALKQLLEAGADVAGTALSRVDARSFGKYAGVPMSYQYNRPVLKRIG